MRLFRQRWLALSVALYFLGFVAVGEALAQSRERRSGRGGSTGRGGGFSSKGPASSGSIGRGPAGGRPSSLGPAANGSLHGKPSRPSGTKPGWNRPGSESGKPGRPGRPGLKPDRPGRPDYRPDRPHHRPDRPHYRPGRPVVQHHHHYHRDRWNDWRDYRRSRAIGVGIVAGAVIVGSILNAAAFHDLGCSPTVVVVNGVSFYRCGSNWFTRSFNGGDVTYIVVDPPYGY